VKKPTVYLDTTVISAYWYEGQNVIAFGRRIMTREWWDSERHEFAIWTSEITVAELEAGKYPRQKDACGMAYRIRLLPLNRDIRDFSNRLIEAGIVPDTKPGDAMQMAVASVHRIDYLLTWNYAHLANPHSQERLTRLCSESGYRAPDMVTAETIPMVKHGQSLRRTGDGDA
jgi:hypothetical protein